VLELARGILESAWRKRVIRPLALPCPSVAIGGATMGGSGKTPLAIACTFELATAGARATLVGHAYRAAPSTPRFVAPDDDLNEVGDEALLAARALAGLPLARVAVAPGRAARARAIAWAAGSTDVLVLDGVAQTHPARASLALLAVDAEHPWGPPSTMHRFAMARRGALRQAPIAMLVAACDAIVPLVETQESGGAGSSESERTFPRLARLGRPVWPATVSSRGAWVGQSLLTWEALRSQRVGLITALARPERVVRWLVRQGVTPVAVVSARDHGPVGPKAAGRVEAITVAGRVDVWVATAKCALHAARVLPPCATLASLDYTVAIGPELLTRLRNLFLGAG
jgi:tetraacyldisaccharide-1-P 4'-kinase